MDDKVKKILREYIGEKKRYDIYVVWKCKVLQNAKWLLCTNLPDVKYYEITYNGNNDELYIDEYEKQNNHCITRPFQ